MKLRKKRATEVKPDTPNDREVIRYIKREQKFHLVWVAIGLWVAASSMAHTFRPDSDGWNLFGTLAWVAIVGYRWERFHTNRETLKFIERGAQR